MLRLMQRVHGLSWKRRQDQKWREKNWRQLSTYQVAGHVRSPTVDARVVDLAPLLGALVILGATVIAPHVGGFPGLAVRRLAITHGCDCPWTVDAAAVGERVFCAAGRKWARASASDFGVGVTQGLGRGVVGCRNEVEARLVAPSRWVMMAQLPLASRGERGGVVVKLEPS